MPSRSRPALAPALALLLAACGGGGGGDDEPEFDAAPAPDCLEAEEHSDLAWLEENVFTPSCASFSSCHKGAANSAGDLNLESGNVFTNTVDVPSDLVDGMDIVEPGSPTDSFMLVQLGQFGTDDPRIDPAVGTMPYNLPLLCRQKRDAIGRWIESL
jgi:hypothetical protein